MKLGITTYPPAPKGMFPGLMPHLIPNDGARYLRDVLIDKPGVLARRGPIQNFGTVSPISNHGYALTHTYDPGGNWRGLLISRGASNLYKLTVFDSTGTSLGTATPTRLNSPTPAATTAQNAVVMSDCKPALGGGVWCGLSSFSNPTSVSGSTWSSPVQSLFLWKGGYFDGTVSVNTTTTSNSAVVAFSGGGYSSVSPGCFLFDSSGNYIGCIKSVDSPTQVTLEKNALVVLAGSASATVRMVRGFIKRIGRGTATLSTAAATVTGTNTKFLDAGLGTQYRMYRLRDHLTPGTAANSIVTAAPANNTSVSLVGVPTVNFDNEEYFFLKNNGAVEDNQEQIAGSGVARSSANSVGFLNASWNQRQWFANLGRVDTNVAVPYHSRLWVSERHDPENVDLSDVSGDYLYIQSSTEVDTPIRGICPTVSSLVVFKEDETFIVTGNDRDTFQKQKLLDDGLVDVNAYTPYRSGVVWAGHNGIYYYDGYSVNSLSEQTLSDWYRGGIDSFNTDRYRIFGWAYHDYVGFHIENFSDNIVVRKAPGAVETTTNLNILVYMPTALTNPGGVVTWSNFNILQSLKVPRGVSPITIALANTYNVTDNGTQLGTVTEPFDKQGFKARLFRLDTIFNTEGNDQYYGQAPTAAQWLKDTKTFVGTDLALYFTSIVGTGTESGGQVTPSGGAAIQYLSPPSIGSTQLYDGNPTIDSKVQAGFTVGATAGDFIGVILKGTDSTNSLRVETTMAGAARIRSTVAGVNTDIATTALGALGTGNTVWAEGHITGNLVVAKFYNGDPNVSGAQIGSTISGLLTGGDLTAWGENVNKRPGFILGGAGNTGAMFDWRYTPYKWPPGPDGYGETVRDAFGDPATKKWLRQLNMVYIVANSKMRLQHTVGLSSSTLSMGTDLSTSTTTWASIASDYITWVELASARNTWADIVSIDFTSKRIRFSRRDRYYGFVFSQRDPYVTAMRIANWSISWKPLAGGR